MPAVPLSRPQRWGTMVDFALTDEQRQLRALAREFAGREIVPKAAHHDQTGEFPREICRKAWDLGLMNTHVPEQYGGPGLGVLDGRGGFGFEHLPPAGVGRPAEVGLVGLVGRHRVGRFPPLEHQRQLEHAAVDALVGGEVLPPQHALVGGQRRLGRGLQVA